MPSKWPSGDAVHQPADDRPLRPRVDLHVGCLGRRLRGAGLLGSMGSIGDCFDNSVVESFFGTFQLKLLDEHHWESRQPLAQAT